MTSDADDVTKQECELTLTPPLNSQSIPETTSTTTPPLNSMTQNVGDNMKLNIYVTVPTLTYQTRNVGIREVSLLLLALSSHLQCSYQTQRGRCR